MSKKPSTAMRLLSLVWDHTSEAAPKTWERLNNSMRAALALAIDSGMAFSLYDFKAIYLDFRSGHWLDQEAMYGRAIIGEHKTYVEAFEHHTGRVPIKAWDVRAFANSAAIHNSTIRREKERLAVGFEFTYQGERFTVTSFASPHVVACTYDQDHKIKRRVKLDQEALTADHKETVWKRMAIETLIKKVSPEQRKVLVQRWEGKSREALLQLPRAEIEKALIEFCIEIQPPKKRGKANVRKADKKPEA